MFNFLQRFLHSTFFLHSSDIVQLSKTQVLTEKDFVDLPKSLDPTQSPTARLFRWDLSPTKFLFSLFKIYRERLSKAFVFFTLAMISSLISPNLIHLFIERLTHHGDFVGNIWIAAALASCGLITGLGFQHYFYHCLGTFQMITNDLNEEIFSHSLRLSMSSRGKSQVGDIVNYMSSDSDAIADSPIIIGDLIWAVITIFSVSVMLFFYIGWTALVVLVLMAGLIPLTRFVSKKFVFYDEKMMLERDQRVTLISQILNAIRIVKYFSWEKAVFSEVDRIRSQELKSRQKLARAEVLSGISYLAIGTIVLFAAFLVHTWRGQELTVATLFTCLSLFGLLEEPFGNLSRLFSRFSQAIVSYDRIRNFLSLEPVRRSENLPSSQEVEGLSFQLKDVSFYHDQVNTPVLNKLQLSVQKRESIAIVGAVGSGKSSLLLGLLGECRFSEGSFYKDASQSLAYVPQEAYIINSSLFENLRFGSNQASKEFLRKCVHASCLDKDLHHLPAGLKTEIGEKGVNLSGGQKQRVSLARAALIDPQIVLLDDPLSAVDIETERKICDRLIFGLWKDATRVMVTHRLESLHRFDRVIFLHDGKIRAQGSFSEILRNCPEFAAFYSEHKEDSLSLKIKNETEDIATEKDDKIEIRITEDEEREKGAVKSQVYWDYILALGGSGPHRNKILALLVVGALSATALPLLQRWWLAYFSNHRQEWNTWNALWVFGALGVLVLLVGMASQLLWLERGLAVGRDLHNLMLKNLLKAPIRFFDSTPVGRILQRFSRDIESVDVYLQWSFEAFIRSILQVLVALVLILVVLPPMIFVVAPTFWIYYNLQLNYRRPAREAKRLDSVARSPRYAHFKETLLGLTVIRAFRREEWFLSEFYTKLKHSQRMFYGHYMLNRWFSSRIPVVGSIITLGTVCGVAWAVHTQLIDSGLAGLLTIYSLSFWGQLNWSIRIFSDIESRMTSVERLRFYSSIESEEKESSILPSLPVSWPRTGNLAINDISVRYAAHLPLVLNNVSFKIQSGSKVGVIGRTGSGKSTLFQALYRFVELESGHIEIDGVNIANLPLENLRSSLAIVPQDPTLFLGTLRSNLDRYNKCSDEEIFLALRKTGLETFIRGLPHGLNSAVVENGLNLSQGQRQLLCLARALLLNAKIILMDEATASVDVQTDALIQKVLKETLQNTTLIIIAHRLETVRDCDQIIEMSEGRIIHVQEKQKTVIESHLTGLPYPIL